MPGGFQPPAQSDGVRLAIRAWNLLGGLEWSGLETVADLLGYDDIELLITQLTVIRDHQRAE